MDTTAMAGETATVETVMVAEEVLVDTESKSKSVFVT